MESSRRNWLKTTGLGIAGIGFKPFRIYASRTPFILDDDLKEKDLPINLNSNENPYGISSLAQTAMLEYVNKSNRYNWDITIELIETLARKNNVTADNILLGAGSTEILDLVARFTALDKGSFVIPHPSYTTWTEPIRKLGMQKIAVPLTADKKIDLSAMLSVMKLDTRLVYICNPNNPSGTMCDRDALVNFILEASKKAMVMVDEAYLDFTEQPSICNLVMEHKNVVVTKTFSKIYGLAGARVGYGIAHASTIQKLSDLQSWPNGAVSVASTAAALASVKDVHFVEETYAMNEKVKKYTLQQLEQLNLTCIPSHTNFIYFSLEKYNKNYFQQLINHKILGTYVYEEQGVWTRITVGTNPEMQQFIRAIQM